MTMRPDGKSETSNDKELRSEKTYTVTRSGELVVDVKKLMRSPAFRKSHQTAKRIIELERERVSERAKKDSDP